MKRYRGFIRIVLFYILFTVLCSLLGGSLAGYEHIILSVWYFATLAVWLVSAVVWVSLIVKIQRLDEIKLKQRIIRKKE